jgi:hypothetical protein
MGSEHHRSAGKTKSNRQSFDNIQDTPIPDKILSWLASGTLYEFCSRKIFDIDNKDLPETLCQVPDEWTFLDCLVRAGALSLVPSLMDAIREMLSDMEPFYESLHQSVLDAIMMANVRQVTMDCIVGSVEYAINILKKKKFIFQMAACADTKKTF